MPDPTPEHLHPWRGSLTPPTSSLAATWPSRLTRQPRRCMPPSAPTPKSKTPCSRHSLRAGGWWRKRACGPAPHGTTTATTTANGATRHAGATRATQATTSASAADTGPGQPTTSRARSTGSSPSGGRCPSDPRAARDGRDRLHALRQGHPGCNPSPPQRKDNPHDHPPPTRPQAT